jgi:starvation-inducible outer membrane lipoprotein
MTSQTNRKKNTRIAVAAIATAAMLASCTTVKEYQKNKLNDSEMSLSARKIEKTEMSFQTYREGASGANGGKTGGGCGCN